MAWVFPDEATEATNRLLDALTDGRAFVPALWPAEVAAAGRGDPSRPGRKGELRRMNEDRRGRST